MNTDVIQTDAPRPTTSGARPPRRWVADEIARLDPETDYERIVSLVANYQLSEFAVNLGYVVGFHTITMPTPGSTAMVGTGKAENRKQSRFFDTVEYTMMWMTYGASDQRVKDSLVRLNRVHAHLAEKFPGSFDQNIDFLVTLAQMTISGDRMRDFAGAPRQTRNVQLAFHHLFRDLTGLFHTELAPVHGYPETYEEVFALVEEFESRDYGPTPESGRRISEAMIGQFTDKYFPKFRALGRAVVLAFVPEAAQRRHDVIRANPVLVWLVRRAFRVLFLLQDTVKPDPTVPLYEAMSQNEYVERRKKHRQLEKQIPLPTL